MNTNPASVLVVENHPLMQEAICSAIAAEPDLKVAALAFNSAEALQMMSAIQPDVIHLADMILFAVGNPGLDDLEALKEMQKSLPDTPILALTSNEVPGQEQAALNSGARMVLTKASPRAVLINTLRELRLGTPGGYTEVDLGVSLPAFLSQKSAPKSALAFPK
jgi:DNA-binding NarL/FixJ family response regulator